MVETFSTIRESLDWLKVFIKDKGGVFILGAFMGVAPMFAFYKSEQKMNKYLEQQTADLKNQVTDCEKRRDTDKDDFLKNMRDVWQFSEQLKNGFQEAEKINREAVDSKTDRLKQLKNEQ